MCVLWFGARLVVDGKLTAGELSAFVVYAIFVSGNVGALAGVFSSLIQARRCRVGIRAFMLRDFGSLVTTWCFDANQPQPDPAATRKPAEPSRPLCRGQRSVARSSVPQQGA